MGGKRLANMGKRRRPTYSIKRLLALKDRANVTRLPVREKCFWSGKSQVKVREF